MISKYLAKKIEHKMHLSYFAGIPHKKTTIFILRDTRHNYNFDVVDHRFRNAHFHIIDISDVREDVLDDDESYLVCSGAHYGFHSCVLKLRPSSPVTEVGWPCHFQHFPFYNQVGTSPTKAWWDSVDNDDLYTIFDITNELAADSE